MSNKLYEISMDTRKAVALWVALRHRVGTLDGSAQLAADENFAVYLTRMEVLERQFSEEAHFGLNEVTAT